MDKKRSAREQNLIEWGKPYLKDHHKLDRLMDQRLEGQYSTEGAKKVAALALQCLSHYPKSRPRMKRVVKILEPVLGMKDIPSGPFVYVVAKEEKVKTTSSGDEENDETKLKGNGNKDKEEVKKEMGCSHRRKGYRHKHPIRSRAVYTDTHLYTTFKNEIHRKNRL